MDSHRTVRIWNNDISDMTTTKSCENLRYNSGFNAFESWGCFKTVYLYIPKKLLDPVGVDNQGDEIQKNDRPYWLMARMECHGVLRNEELVKVLGWLFCFGSNTLWDPVCKCFCSVSLPDP